MAQKMAHRWGIGLILIALQWGAAASAATYALTHGTLIDVSQYGRATRDIDDTVVVIDGDRIVAAGPATEVSIPQAAQRIDAHGGYFIPGLIDGFSTIKTQGFANAWLYNGVTSVSVNRGRRVETRLRELLQVAP